MGVFTAFITKHGRPWELRIPNGKGVVIVHFYDGYVELVSRQPGVAFDTSITLTRKSWIRLLKSVVEPTRRMSGPDFDPNRAMRRYLREEQQHAEELRKQKRGRREDPEARRRQRQRWLRARARAEE